MTVLGVLGSLQPLNNVAVLGDVCPEHTSGGGCGLPAEASQGPSAAASGLETR